MKPQSIMTRAAALGLAGIVLMACAVQAAEVKVVTLLALDLLPQPVEGGPADEVGR